MSFVKLIAKLKIPVIQAPMAGGIATTNLVTAVANSGAVGSFGFAYNTPAKIFADLKSVASQSAGVINANFFVIEPPQSFEPSLQLASIQTLQAIPFNGDVPIKLPDPPYSTNLDEQLEPVWFLKPSILSFHFGIPTENIITKAHRCNILVGISATCLAEAKLVQEVGADFIIAQGIEAGGHRGTFYADPDDNNNMDDKLPLPNLLQSLTDDASISLPVVAAGGIMTGVDIVTYLKMGCAAVQMGTAFLTCQEAGTSASYKHILLQEHNRNTCFTRGFSGRNARSICNSFTRYMESKPVLPFPIQNSMTSAMRQKAQLVDNPEYQSLWAGSNYAKCRALSASELILALQKEISSCGFHK